MGSASMSGGLETLGLAFEAIQDYAERRMRAAISALPAGTGGLSSISDTDGVVTSRAR